MNLYSTIFETRTLSVQLSVNPRGKNSEDILTRYKSKKGFESLIFNPVISVVFMNKYDKDSRIVVPYQMIYQVSNTLSKVYSDITSIEKLYVRDDHGQLIIDKALAEKKAKKISAYTNFIVFTTTVFDDTKGGDYGIAITVGKNLISVLHHSEARSLIEKIEHLDITSYSMLCAIASKVATIEHKVDDIYNILVSTQERANKNKPEETLPKMKTGTFEWHNVDDDDVPF